MENFDAELRADRGGWSVIVFRAGRGAKVVYRDGERGAPGVYRAEGVANFLSTRRAAAEAAWEESSIPWHGR